MVKWSIIKKVSIVIFGFYNCTTTLAQFATLELPSYSYKTAVSHFGVVDVKSEHHFHQPGILAKQVNQSPRTDTYIYKSASELAKMIRNGETSSYDIVKEFIEYIKKNNQKYHAIIWLREKDALKEAKEADLAVAKGSILSELHGVPVTVKEEFWIKGSPVTLNSKLYEDFVAPEDSPLVTQLKKAGAIIIGKTNLPTLLMDFQTQGEVYPTGSNPYDTSRTPGGSTGGGAAALAAGFTTIELGSDLGGSIRVPASFCGLYGLKTTLGSLNITEGDGADTVSERTRFALNTAGILARNPGDLAIAWRILKDAKPDPKYQKPISWSKPSGKGFAEYRIAWVDEWNTSNGLVQVGRDVSEKLRLLIDSLNTRGVVTKKYAPDTYEEMMVSYFTCLALLAGEGKSADVRSQINMNMEVWDDGTGMLDPFYSTMKNPDDIAWDTWQNQNNKLISKWDKFFRKFDFLILPITYGPAFTKCDKGSAITTDGVTIPYFRYFPYATILNPIECPAITIPLGLNDEGLPITVQVIGPRFSEPELLHFAQLIRPVVPGFIRPE